MGNMKTIWLQGGDLLKRVLKSASNSALQHDHRATMLAVVILGLSGLGLAPSAKAEGIDLKCAQAVATELTCEIRLKEPVQPEEITVRANGATIKEPAFDPFISSGGKSAWLYLIDTSNPRRAATVRINREIARSQISRVSENRMIGVATFASEMSTVLPIASSHFNPQQALDAIQADGVATEFYSNALEAIKLLKAADADRKALVIMSDGKAEDTAYSLNDVVSAADEAGVIIIGLGFAESASETPSLQSIRRLAEETDGFFEAVVSGQQLPANFTASFTRHLENGGTVSFPSAGLDGDVEIAVDARLPDGRTVSEKVNFAVAGPSPLQEEPETLAGQIYTFFDSFIPGASKWADNNSILALVVLGLPIILLAIFGLLLGRNKQATDDGDGDQHIDGEFDIADGGELSGDFDDYQDEPATRVVGSVGAFGFFEVVGNEAQHYPVTSSSCSIGRHSDNDIQLINDTVHRHHAHIRTSPDGAVSIHDLDTANGVLVNGQQVSVAQLNAGDLVELGEVRLRFNT